MEETRLSIVNSCPNRCLHALYAPEIYVPCSLHRDPVQSILEQKERDSMSHWRLLKHDLAALHPRVIVEIDEPADKPAESKSCGDIRVAQPCQKHGANCRQEILDIVCMGALGAVVGKDDRVGRCLFGRGRELRIEDLCTGTEGRTDVDGLDGAEDKGRGCGKKDHTVGGRNWEQDGGGHIRFTLLALRTP